MAKFKILDNEEAHTVTLRQNLNGTVTLGVDEYSILTINNDGKVKLTPDVPCYIGLSLDAEGFVVTCKDGK